MMHMTVEMYMYLVNGDLESHHVLSPVLTAANLALIIITSLLSTSDSALRPWSPAHYMKFI